MCENVVLAYFHFPFKVLWTFPMLIVDTACSLRIGNSLCMGSLLHAPTCTLCIVFSIVAILGNFLL